MTCATCRGTKMIGTFDFPRPGNEPRPCPDCDLNVLIERRDFARKRMFAHRTAARNADTIAISDRELKNEDHYRRVERDTSERIRALIESPSERKKK